MGHIYNLIARVKNPELLSDLIHELGSLFYQKLGKSKYRVVYFSGSRVVVFEGKLPNEIFERIKNMGYEVNDIKIDEDEKLVIIEQLEGKI